ncbi:RNA methyltransferase [Desulfonatronovibrio hydrogenovorans]|uniref:RNA methyltransferase n=1 Tax=Desulfonatronovibrio hydrogenovorans TaxID=53245 RepID=UPI0004912D7C|nr:RNA methyltransferase [Desulfonatronovibrio hydrogenovorans]
MLDNVSVILVRPKYPENIGSVARACINMDCPGLILVSPRDFDLDRAAPLATARGKKLLEQALVVDNLKQALTGFHRAYATTARLGKWRKGILTPWEAGAQIMDLESGPARSALVFGPEDTGLLNEEVELCSHILSIPTSRDAWSLNLAQAVLIVLYECFKQVPVTDSRRIKPGDSRLITMEENRVLHQNIQEALLEINFLQPDNPDYFMMPLKRFMSRADLRLHEFNLLMGICRQIRWMAGK